MQQLKRKNRTGKDLGLLAEGGMRDIFDNTVKTIYRINDDEYDYVAEKINDEEIKIFVNEKPSYSEKRMLMRILNKYLDDFEQQKTINNA